MNNIPHTPAEVEFPRVIRPIQILFAHDGSKHAQAAVEMLCDLPLAPESTVLVLAVVPTLDISQATMLESALDKSYACLHDRGLKVFTEIKGGIPAATINDYAQRDNPDIIVLGAKGLRATLGILLGGVAQQVVEYSCCPVWVVRAPYQGIKRVLFVTDGSKSSQDALEFLSSPPLRDSNQSPKVFPLPSGVDMRIMHVLPPSFSSEMVSRALSAGPDVLFTLPQEPFDEDEIKAEEESKGKELLGLAIATLKSAGIQASSILKRGDAATEIIKYVQENNIDLVVCGSRGLSQVSGWLLGSVSRKLVHYADCSVLIVKSGLPSPRVA